MKIIKDKFIIMDGFLGESFYSGVKKKRDDLMLVKFPDGAVSAGVFTTNITKAAPVVVSLTNLASDKIYGLVVNSGNANACTGKQGMDDAITMCESAAKAIGCSSKNILIASTGIIGKVLEMDKIAPAIESGFINISKDGMDNISKGIITTDTFEKKCSVQFYVGGKLATVSGVSKGSGMIHPNMATMLGFAFTDVDISKEMLQAALDEVTLDTFNMISVDGDTSTNDTVFAFSSGKLKNKVIDSYGDDFDNFKVALNALSKELSMMIAKDGEGATKLLQVTLSGCDNEACAKLLAKSVIASSLVKAAFFGNDANWGRIICALGYSGGKFDPEKVDLAFSSVNGSIELMKSGAPIDFSEATALKVLQTDEIDILINLNDGDKSAVAWGCDLTYDYVKINGDYRS
ncbi:MAG: bifunctional ornithine acetyltransferase/N-acetylglutamate synthase [Acidaminobacteraceae bacterium]